MNQIKKIYVLTRSGLWQKVDYHSEKASAVWSKFWTMLVCGGWAFGEDNLIGLKKHLYKNNYTFYDPDERHYEQAVRINNISFCKAYEKLHGRIPFIWDNIDYTYHWGELPYGMHSTQAKIKGRLVIGASIIWENEKVKVTSFNDEKHSLIACKYTITKEGEVCKKCGRCQSSDETKISKRFTITAIDMAEKLKAIRKIKDEAKKTTDVRESSES
jgi:hypothetical protein